MRIASAAILLAGLAAASGDQNDQAAYSTPIKSSLRIMTPGYINTVIPGYNGYSNTITNTAQPVTLYATVGTITHTPTPTPTPTTYGHAESSGYYPEAATPMEVWYEHYGVVGTCAYKDLGPKALPGYAGSGLCSNCTGEDKDTYYQVASVSEAYGGAGTTYSTTHTYAVPTMYSSVCSTPGTYTVPASTLTLLSPTVVPLEQTTTYVPSTPITYGGVSTSVSASTIVTVPYGAYHTSGAETYPVLMHTTITCPQAGHYTAVQPTVISHSQPTTIMYPSVTSYPAGVYQNSAQTVTINTSGEAYTCSFEQISSYPTLTRTPVGPSSSPQVHPYPVSAPAPYGASPSPIGYGSPSELPCSGEYPTVVPTLRTIAIATPYLPSGNGYPTEAAPLSPVVVGYPTGSATTPYDANSSDCNEMPTENYGTPSAGYVKRGGLLEREIAGVAALPRPVGGKKQKKRVILV